MVYNRQRNQVQVWVNFEVILFGTCMLLRVEVVLIEKLGLLERIAIWAEIAWKIKLWSIFIGRVADLKVKKARIVAWKGFFIMRHRSRCRWVEKIANKKIGGIQILEKCELIERKATTLLY